MQQTAISFRKISEKQKNVDKTEKS